MRGAALAMPIGIAYYFAGPIDKASRPDSPHRQVYTIGTVLNLYF